MPFLIRIILQRVLIGSVSVLTFLGINPEITINTDRTGPIIFTDQSEDVVAVLERRDKNNNVPQATSTEAFENTLEEGQGAIPLPQKNILEEIKKRAAERDFQNISAIDATKTQPPVFAQPPNKSLPGIPEQRDTIPQPETPIVVPVKETIDPNIIKAFEDALTKELEKQQETTQVAEVKKTVSTNNSEKSTIENSVVNIQCVRRNGNEIKLSTGSGVIISPNGVVITNAHVAQYFLLEDLGYNCTLHRENSSLYGFKADALYISEQWIENNFMLLTISAPTGTGEDDYALLYITESTVPSVSLPGSFSYMPANTTTKAADIGDSVTAAGYPGKSTGSFELDSSLSLVRDITSIINVFTFGRSSIDVISTDDTSVARQGSSGGGIFKDDTLVGIIATTNPGNSRDLQRINAITLDYIDRDIVAQTGKDITDYIAGNLASLAQSFRVSVAPRLTELLLQNL